MSQSIFRNLVHLLQFAEHLHANGRHTRFDEYSKFVEETVDDTEPRIRLVRGYRQKLSKAVMIALQYANKLVERMPGAIEISQKNFTRDPHVNAFFTNPEEIRQVFHQSSEVRDFLQEDMVPESQETCALLCMHKTEDTRFGISLTEDSMQRDVAQTVINFSDHRVLSPSHTEKEARVGLKQCIYQGLVNNALEHLSEQRQARKSAETRYAVLTSKLRHLRARLKQHVPDPAKKYETEQEILIVEARLRAVERDLEDIPVMTPERALQQVCDVLQAPEHYIHMQRSELTVDKMGIKSDDNSRPLNALDLTEVYIHGHQPRTVVLARFSPADIMLH